MEQTSSMIENEVICPKHNVCINKHCGHIKLHSKSECCASDCAVCPECKQPIFDYTIEKFTSITLIGTYYIIKRYSSNINPEYFLGQGNEYTCWTKNIIIANRFVSMDHANQVLNDIIKSIINNQISINNINKFEFALA